MYALVKDGAIERVVIDIPRAFENISGFHLISDAERKARGWYAVNLVDPPFDPATQVREGPVDSYDSNSDTVSRVFTVRDKTPEELALEEAKSDLAQVREATKDVVLILTELIQWMMANTPIQATDFTANVRAAYLDLKTLADRIKARG